MTLRSNEPSEANVYADLLEGEGESTEEEIVYADEEFPSEGKFCHGILIASRITPILLVGTSSSSGDGGDDAAGGEDGAAGANGSGGDDGAGGDDGEGGGTGGMGAGGDDVGGAAP